MQEWIAFIFLSFTANWARIEQEFFNFIDANAWKSHSTQVSIFCFILLLHSFRNVNFSNVNLILFCSSYSKYIGKICIKEHKSCKKMSWVEPIWKLINIFKNVPLVIRATPNSNLHRLNIMSDFRVRIGRYTVKCKERD